MTRGNRSGHSICWPLPPSGLDRRSFLQITGVAPLLSAAGHATTLIAQQPNAGSAASGLDWPVLRRYRGRQLARIAMPVGGIGTGTVSLCGNGSLRHWEIMNRPAKGFTPSTANVEPFFALWIRDGTRTSLRVLEGPLADDEFEASHGSRAPNANLPRFPDCEFLASYPFGAVQLRDPDLPVEVLLEAFNPLVPADEEASGLPIAVFTVYLRNLLDRPFRASVVFTLPNFIGEDGSGRVVSSVGQRRNRNSYRESGPLRGIFMEGEGLDPNDEAWGTIAFAVAGVPDTSYRTAWLEARWGGELLDFWDDLAADGHLDNRLQQKQEAPLASLCAQVELPGGTLQKLTFLLGWHFPNRYSWSVAEAKRTVEDRIGNYYATLYRDAWHVLETTWSRLEDLRRRTVRFLQTFCSSDYPRPLQEAALFNLSTLRTQTAFRTPDGRFFGWEGCSDHTGCCRGSCTHVWNYEQATAFVFGRLALSMREVEFAYATDEQGLMSFRVGLPLERRAREFRRAAADGQMGCIVKMYRDWQLSGDSELLQRLWPKIRKALEFCWIPGGWDGDRDGVMEGVQHNTMDVEYLGPNPEIGFWYLAALRAAERMAEFVGDRPFAQLCRDLFERGSRWIDEHLFNGEYYVQDIRPVLDKTQVAEFLLVGMGPAALDKPDYQLGEGCLVDQLVGQLLAHICDLGYLARPEHILQAYRSILKYNRRSAFWAHFNPLRTYAADDERGLLVAAYPKHRPQFPFPYYAEVWTGLEYAAAAGMIYEGLVDEAVDVVRDARARHDGRRRNPFDEAECGHHYARAMSSWALLVAFSGFHYSAVEKRLQFAPRPGTWFWSSGYSWGTCTIRLLEATAEVTVEVIEGRLAVESFRLRGFGEERLPAGTVWPAGTKTQLQIARS